MELARFLEIFLYTIPAIITGLVAFYFFREHTRNEDGRRRYLLNKKLQTESFPVRLQAYERMALFLERINPNKLLVRVGPTSNDKDSYESLLIATIEQEFEHNLSQQIYLSDKCWNIIAAAKNATIQIIRKAGLLEKTKNADKLREVVLTEMMEKRAPSDAALAFIKEEVSQMW
jgi:hypothetical protein